MSENKMQDNQHRSSIKFYLKVTCTLTLQLGSLFGSKTALLPSYILATQPIYARYLLDFHGLKPVDPTS